MTPPTSPWDYTPRPPHVYPYHYRGQNGLSDVAAFQKTVHAANQKIDVRLRNWYPAAQ